MRKQGLCYGISGRTALTVKYKLNEFLISDKYPQTDKPCFIFKSLKFFCPQEFEERVFPLSAKHPPPLYPVHELGASQLLVQQM